MPRKEFISSNRVEQREDFPKLKLDAEEKARIWCPELPIAEYVHNLRMPKIGPDGKAVYKTERDKDGNEKQKQEFDFVGRPLCLGQLSELEESGIDPKNCPACREAVKSDYVDKPVRRFAMHVVQYNTKPDGKPTTPFGATTKIWSFTDFVFDKLVDMASEYGDLKDLDIALACKSKVFQQYEMSANPVKVWYKESEANKALVDQVFAENQAKDLKAYCGRTVKRELMEGDIIKIRQRWDSLMGRSAATESVSQSEVASLTEGLDGLLGGSDKPAPKVEEKREQSPAEAVDFGDLFS